MLPSENTLHLLIVEDNIGDFILIGEYLKDRVPGVIIDHADTLTGAKEKLAAACVYDAVLLDLSLPDGSGEKMVTAMVRLAGATPVIILTGYHDESFGIKALSLGISDYLVKDGLNALQLYKSISYSIERKRISEKLNESEAKHKNLFQVNPVPMWVYDPGTYKFLDVNEAAVKHYGYSREEFFRMKLQDIRPRSDAKKVEAAVEVSKKRGGLYEGVFDHYKKDGSLIHVNVRSNSIDFDGKSARLVAITDVTEKIKAEEALRLSEQRFKGLVQEGSDLISILDLRGICKYVSPTSISILGTAAENFIGKNVFDYIHDSDKKTVIDEYNLLLTKKQIHLSPFRFKIADNKYRWIETIVTNMMDDPSIKGIVANSKDVSQRYLYEEKLRKQEGLFRAIIEKSSDMKTLIRPDGTIMFGTPSITRILGYRPEEYLGTSTIDLVHPGDRDKFEQAVDAVIKNELPFASIQLRIKNKKGEYRWCEKTITNLLDDPNVNAIVCNCRDIADKKEAEIKLQESNNRYNLVAKATSDAIWDFDTASGKNYVSGSGYKHLFGYNIVNDYTPDNFWETHLHPEEKERVMQEMDAAMRNENIEQSSIEYRLLKADGTYAYVRDRFFIMREKGRAVRMIGAKQDVTHQKEEEHRLKLLESVINNAKDAVLITEADPLDSAGPKMLYVNKAFVQMTGYSKSEMIGHTPRMFQGAATDRATLDKVRRALEQRESCDVEVINYTKSGEPYWVEISIAPVTNASGRVSHFIAIEKDITGRKIQEQERERLIHELTQNNGDLRQFSYITSHNLRGPIASLLGLCTLIDNYKIEDPTLKQILEGVKKATYMFDETIKDLTTVLNVRDRTSIPKENLNLLPIYEKAISQSEVFIKEFDAHISVDFAAAPVINYNKAYMESIFSNLITNAIKYRSPLRKLKVFITTEVSGEHIIMRFSDNGLGIDLEHNKEKMFRLYQRFHDHVEGKGLGLFLIKSQMEALNGSIDIESTLGEGTTFILKFRK